MEIDKDNAWVLETSSLMANLQDIMMEAALEIPKKYGEKPRTPHITITRQIYDGEKNTLTLETTKYNWGKKKWGNPETTKALPMHHDPIESFEDYYWSLEVSGVTITSILRYRTFEDAAGVALYYEKPWSGSLLGDGEDGEGE